MKEILNHNLEKNNLKNNIITNIRENIEIIRYNILKNNNRVFTTKGVEVSVLNGERGSTEVAIITANLIPISFPESTGDLIIMLKTNNKILISNHEFCINYKAFINILMLPIKDLRMIEKELESVKNILLNH